MTQMPMNRYERWLAKKLREIIEADERAEPQDTGLDAIEALPAFDEGELESEATRHPLPSREVRRWFR